MYGFRLLSPNAGRVFTGLPASRPLGIGMRITRASRNRKVLAAWRGAARRGGEEKCLFLRAFSVRIFLSHSRYRIHLRPSRCCVHCALCTVHRALCSVEFYTFRFTTPPAPDPRSPSVPVSPRCPLEYAIGIGLAFAPFGNSVISPSVRQSVSQ